MKSFLLALLAIVALIGIDAEPTNFVNWAPFTNDFQMIQFTFPIDMNYFVPVQGENFAAEVQIDFSGAGIRPNKSIIIKQHSASVSKSAPFASWGAIVTNSHDNGTSFPVICEAFPKGHTNFSCYVTFYLPVTNIVNPSVKITVTSSRDRTRKIADPTFYHQLTPPTPLGKLSAVFTNTKRSNRDSFVFTVHDLNFPTTSETQLFAICNRSPYGGKFVSDGGAQGRCTINELSSFDVTVVDGTLMFPIISLAQFDSTITIACPNMFVEYATTDQIFEIVVSDQQKNFYLAQMTATTNFTPSTPLNFARIAGIAIAAIVAVVAVGALVWCCVNKKRNDEGAEYLIQ